MPSPIRSASHPAPPEDQLWDPAARAAPDLARPLADEFFTPPGGSAQPSRPVALRDLLNCVTRFKDSERIPPKAAGRHRPARVLRSDGWNRRCARRHPQPAPRGDKSFCDNTAVERPKTRPVHPGPRDPAEDTGPDLGHLTETRQGASANRTASARAVRDTVCSPCPTTPPPCPRALRPQRRRIPPLQR